MFVPFRARRALAALALGTLALAAPLHADTLWTMSTDADIVFQRLTPLGNLLVSTVTGLSAVDPATGGVMWTRDEIKKLKECDYDEIANTPYGLLDLAANASGTRRRVEIIDLQTGRPKWDSQTLPLKSSQGTFQAPQQGMLMLAGVPERGARTVMIGVDAETGQLRWRQDDLFEKPLQTFEVRGSGMLIRRFSITGNQPPLFDTERTAILWMSQDGPIKIDLATGERLWKSRKLAGKTPPAPRSGWAPMLLGKGVAFVPYEESLQAIDVQTGALVWPKTRELPSRVMQMRLTPRGLVVRGAPNYDAKGKLTGKPFIDCLDPLTGRSVWKKPFRDLEHATTFDVRGDELYVAADGELFAIDLLDGRPRTVTKFKFKGNEMPTRLEIISSGYCLMASQNMMLVSPDGSVRYHDYYVEPGTTGWKKITQATIGTPQPIAAEILPTTPLTPHPVLAKRFEASRSAAGYTSMLTDVEGDDGSKGIGLVKLEKSTGNELAKVILGDKRPLYELDAIEGRVFLVKSDKTIVCYKF